MRRLLADVGLQQEEPSTIFEDNQGAIELSKNPKFHNRTKHIGIWGDKNNSVLMNSLQILENKAAKLIPEKHFGEVGILNKLLLLLYIISFY